MSFTTAELCDRFPDELSVADPLLRDFGGVSEFSGLVATVDVFEDNGLVREILEAPGEDRILVVDGGGSTNRALIDATLAQCALDNGWAGLVVHGCVREAARLEEIPLGIKALNVTPLAARSIGRGVRDQITHFAGVTFRDGHYLYADRDGIVIAERDLLTPPAVEPAPAAQEEE